MQNKTQLEYVGIVFNLKEKRTAKGWIYSFSIPVSKQNGEEELREWMRGAIFSKEQVPGLRDRGDVHFTAELSVNPAYNDRPQSIGFFGFEIEPIFGKAFRISNKKHKDDPDSHSVSAGMNDPSPRQVQAYQQQTRPPEPTPHYQQPAAPLPEMDSEIPF